MSNASAVINHAPIVTPIAVVQAKTIAILLGTAILALLAYYFLGFPCH